MATKVRSLVDDGNEILDQVKDYTKEVTAQVKSKAQDVVDNSMESIQQGGKDWVEYVKTHPVQSIFFGLIGYFALKGFWK